MTQNSLIEQLGFSPSDKVVIFHIDDMGFSHAANIASFECLDFGIASCGSVIVPSPWLLEAASIAKNNPKYDIGVHLTLTAEYDLYRWRALSSTNPTTGLLDEERCLWRTAEEAIANVDPEAAEKEMKTQIDYALQSGIDVTHIDSHMGTVLNPKFIPTYLSLAEEYNIPAFIPKVKPEELIAMGLNEYVDVFIGLITSLEERGVPLIDHMVIDTGGEHPDKIKYYCDRLKEIKPGLTHFLFHPAQMGSELKGITPDSANWRSQDHIAFTSEQLKECVEKMDIQIIGYRRIRELVRKSK